MHPADVRALGASLLAGLWLLLLSAELGLRLLAFRPPPGRQTGGLALAQGLAAGGVVWMLLGMVLSSVHCLSPAPIGWLTAGLSLSLLRSRALPLWKECCRGWGPVSKLLWLGSLLACLAPCTHWDAHLYHYALPRLYLQAGCVYWAEVGPFNGMPHGLHMIYAWAMALGGESAANLWGPAFLWILSMALSSLLPCEKSRETCRILVMSSPVFFTQSSGGLSDLPVAAYSALALCELVGPSSSLWAGLWLAAMLAIRLTAAPAVIALWAIYAWRKPALLLISGVLLWPWLTFNLEHSGNPLYPLGTRWTISVVQQRQPGFILTSLLPPATPLSPSAWLEHLSPWLLVGLLLHRPIPRRLYVCVAVYCGLTQALHLTLIRYALPGLVWLIPGAASGLSASRCRWLVHLSALSMLGWLWPRLPVACGLESRQHFLDARLPQLKAYRWLQSQAYTKVMLTDSRGYLCPLDYCLVYSIDVGATTLLGPQVLQRRVARDVQETRCDVILWNLRAAEARQALETEPGSLSGDSIGAAALQAAGQMSRGGRVVYRDGDILVVKLP